VPNTIQYAEPDTFVFPNGYRALGRVSLIAATFSVAGCSALILRAIAAGRSHYVFIAVLGFMLVLAALLLAAGVLLCRRDLRGLLLHFIYAMTQTFAGIVLSSVAINDLRESQDSMAWYFGLALGGVAISYPLLIVVILWFSKIDYQILERV
jgi:hypothetical protein